jgi:large subunit ribosomal protein L4
MSLQIPVVEGNAENTTRVGTVPVSGEVFGCEINNPLVHQIVVAYLAAGRAGTKAQKTRADVSGGGIKPWRQKGTGRARAGSIRSPLWRTGGVTFAARNRDYTQKVNKKMYRQGMRTILSELLRQDRLCVRDDVYPSQPRTKSVLPLVGARRPRLRTLIVADRLDETLWLAARNLADVALTTSSAVDPVSLVSADRVILTREAVKVLEERLK